MDFSWSKSDLMKRKIYGGANNTIKEIPVVFKNRGQNLKGILHTSKKKTNSCVIFAHGFTGNKREVHFVNCARKLAEKGFAALRFDFRGSGESDGLFRNATISSEISDLEKAIKFMKTKGYKKIGLVGHSLGGSVVILADKRDIKTIALWAPGIHLKKSLIIILGKKISTIEKQGYVIFSWNGKGVELVVGKPLWEEVKNKYPNLIDSLAQIEIPKTVIYGSKDLVLLEDTSPEILKKLSQSSNNLKIIKDADHAFSNIKHEKQLIDYTINWFKRWLK